MAETLAAMRGRTLDAGADHAAWRQLLLCYEHTWGAWNSISEPDSDLARGQWKRKQAFVHAAAEQTSALIADSLGDRIDRDGDGSPDARWIEIVNPLAWSRREVVVLDAVAAGNAVAARDGAGTSLPLQRLKNGGIAFQSPVIEGFSSAHVELACEAIRPEPGVRVPTDAGRQVLLDNGIVQLGLDPLTGRLVSLRRVDGEGTGRNLVPEGDALAEWLYVPGRDPTAARPAGGGRVEISDAGPLLWRAVVRRDAPGTRSGLTAILRLAAGSDRLEIELRFDKQMCLDPEAVLVRFPLALSPGSTQRWVGGARAPFRVDADQAPGANRNWYTVERWADLHDAAGGLGLVSVDAPLVQFGAPGSDPIVTGWRDRVDPSPVLFSYLMNNYWETNYRAAQEGPHAIRYVLRPHAGFDVSVAERAGMEAAHPLLAYRVRPGLQPLDPPVAVEAEHSVVTLLRRTSTSLEIRLFNPNDSSDFVRCKIPGIAVEDSREIRPGDVATIRLPLPPETREAPASPEQGSTR
jgi:hypothetical protein